MLRRMDHVMKEYRVSTSDEDAYRLVDVLFDETSWKVRHFIVRTSSWLVNHQVLLTPNLIAGFRDDDQTLLLSATSKEVQDSPGVDTVMPISKESELLIAKYWQWALPEEDAPLLSDVGHSIKKEANESIRASSENAVTTQVQVRSAEEVTGYHIHAPDGHLGHVEGFIFDDSNWSIQFLIVDTRNWLPAKKVLLPVKGIGEIQWASTSITVTPTREKIKSAPAYDDELSLTTEDEKSIRQHFSSS